LSSDFDREPMLDMFIFEVTQLLEQLEQAIIDSEKSSCYTESAVNEIFRIMHNIKSSSAMMLFNNISTLAHSVEDLFYFLREGKPENVDCSQLSDLVLESVDFIKVEIEKIKNQDSADGDATIVIQNIKSFLEFLKEINSSSKEEIKEPAKTSQQQKYYISQSKISPKRNAFQATILFEEGCEMENIRAYIVVNNLKDITDEVKHIPEDIVDNEDTVEIIRKDGFKVFFKADQTYDEMHYFLMQTVFLKDLELIQLEDEQELSSPPVEVTPIKIPQLENKSIEPKEKKKDNAASSTQQSIISVNVAKLDKLMDLVGELVISEAMVTQNPDLQGLSLDNFQKAASQLRKISGELQDMVMSIRMVPLAATFHKMNRIVRDMTKKLDKEVQLEIIGEETEVDKNIIEHISDPLMHLIRNSLDHGIETTEERKAQGKTEPAKVILEAKNAGGEVLVMVRDNGRGLNKEKILQKAKDNNLLYKPESEMTDREVYSLIFLPGFSTKEKVTEFSGRGVGMDVVTKNIQAVGGSVTIDSIPGEGSTITIKIPLTLAIIDGMIIKVGNSRYTVPTTSIKESFRVKEEDIITDPDGKEMIMVRGQCYPVLRLHELYKVKTEVTNIAEGIILMVENETKSICLFADGLLGEQQVVVKALPNYIRKIKIIKGLVGCTLLGDGGISLILDIAGLMKE